MATTSPDPQYLRAIVDMGSNGIRFSISSLQPPMARIMPTLYQHRAGISLYDAQYSSSGDKQPIDDQTIAAVVLAFQQFKRTCADFCVPAEHVTVLATEATRTAVNSDAFRQHIKDTVGWEVVLMPKAVEGEVGALGIASSLPEVKGLVMDLGGGSTQLSWLASSDEGAAVRMPENGAVSLPYGAAAMSRRLVEAEKQGTVAELKNEVKKALQDAYEHLQLPDDLLQLSKGQGGFTLYLSGGGFRGWGFVLMSKHPVNPYPIPVINGFHATRNQFMDVNQVTDAAAATFEHEDDAIFRVSARRASQVPAVAFLINALAEAVPNISQVRFCQGGVREGHLFKTLPSEVQSLNPLVVATLAFSRTASDPILRLLRAAVPPDSCLSPQQDHRKTLTVPILQSFANLIYYHSSHSQDLQASAALRSTTSGVLASTHGILHESRALLALLLCRRWGGAVPPTDQSFKEQLERLVALPWILWWIEYFGAIAALIAAVYPAGVANGQQGDRLTFKAEWDTGTKGQGVVALTLLFGEGVVNEVLEKEVKAVTKVGKRENWIGGENGIGLKVVMNLAARPS